MPVLLEPPAKVWECPSCGARHQTREHRPHVPFHSCRALGFASIPFLPEDEVRRSRLRLVEREDYVGDMKPGDYVEVDGRPIMAAVTDRPDGSNDRAVYAPIARGGIQ